jgi:hypothetical protein
MAAGITVQFLPAATVSLTQASSVMTAITSQVMAALQIAPQRQNLTLFVVTAILIRTKNVTTV